jgi:hypothetical protein
MPRDPVTRKASNQRYNQSAKGKAAQKAYSQTDQGKARKQAYDQTDQGKARTQRAKQRAASAAAERAASAASASLAFVTELKKLTHAQRVKAYFSQEELLLLLQRPLGVLLVEPHALERAALGAVAAVEVEARVGELLEELGLQHRQADDAAGGLGVPGDVEAVLPQAPAAGCGAGWVAGRSRAEAAHRGRAPSYSSSGSSRSFLRQRRRRSRSAALLRSRRSSSAGVSGSSSRWRRRRSRSAALLGCCASGESRGDAARARACNVRRATE